VLLVWINTTNKFKKLVVVLSNKRDDDITKYCNEINNDKLTITYNCPKELIINNNSTIKTFLKHHYWSEIYTTINKNVLHKYEMISPITLFHTILPNKEQLLNIKKYFNPELNNTMKIKLQ